MTYCLDTNIIIDFFRGDYNITEKLKNIQQNELFITAITLCELYKGAYLSENKEQNINLIEEFLESVEVIGFNNNSCKEFGKLFSYLKSKGKLNDEIDLMIASIIKSHNLILVTRNIKHFEDAGIKTETW